MLMLLAFVAGAGLGFLMGYAIAGMQSISGPPEFLKLNAEQKEAVLNCVADCVGARAKEQGYDPEAMPGKVYRKLYDECLSKCMEAKGVSLVVPAQAIGSQRPT